jgi:adenylate cyclase
VPIAELSSFLSIHHAETGLTPFVLYDRQYVLAHPMIINSQFSSEVQQQPLPTLESFGDIILSRIWTPDEPLPFISEALIDTQASGVLWGDDFYLYLYRDINRYGEAPWTIGAYINTSLQTNNEIDRLIQAMMAGIAVLAIAIVASIFIGRRVSKPIKAIVRAAHAVESGEFDSVPQLPGSRIRELDDASSAFNNMVSGLNERELIRETLGRFVPEKVASSLLAGGGQIQPQQVDATILFCDIESFTQMTESLGPVKTVDVLNSYFSAMVAILEQHGGVITQFQGDAILATFNVPVTNPDHAANAVRAAQEMLSKVTTTDFAGEALNVRIGVNTGPVVAGAIGAEGRLSYTVHGDAVNLAARLENLNKKYGTRLMVSANTTALAQELEFTQVGESAVRGQTQSILLYTLTSLVQT